MSDESLPRPTRTLDVHVSYPAGTRLIIKSLDSGDVICAIAIPYIPTKSTPPRAEPEE